MLDYPGSDNGIKNLQRLGEAVVGRFPVCWVFAIAGSGDWMSRERREDCIMNRFICCDS